MNRTEMKRAEKQVDMEALFAVLAFAIVIIAGVYIVALIG